MSLPRSGPPDRLSRLGRPAKAVTERRTAAQTISADAKPGVSAAVRPGEEEILDLCGPLLSVGRDHSRADAGQPLARRHRSALLERGPPQPTGGPTPRSRPARAGPRRENCGSARWAGNSRLCLVGGAKRLRPGPSLPGQPGFASPSRHRARALLFDRWLDLRTGPRRPPPLRSTFGCLGRRWHRCTGSASRLGRRWRRWPLSPWGRAGP